MVKNYRRAILIYTIIFSLLTVPYWALGNVITPHLQHWELAEKTISTPKTIENRYFGDFNNAYIPEIIEHLNAPRSGWIATWSDKNELGRPMHHMSLFSPAFLPYRLITLKESNAWKIITLISLFNIFASGIFIIFFCREIRLIPLAGLVAGMSMAFSPTLIFWMTFPMFTASWCWGAGTLYGLQRLARKHDIISWAILCFSVHSLIMTSYPQHIVYYIYVLGGYAVWLTVKKWKCNQLIPSRFMLLIASGCLSGLILSLPGLLDLAITARESSRTSTNVEFFTSVLPNIEDTDSLIKFLSLSSVPGLFGNPISPSYQFAYYGLSISITTLFLIAAGGIKSVKKAWYWWLVTLIMLILTFLHPIYRFAVMHMGLSLSRTIPLAILVIPLAIISGCSIENLIESNSKKKNYRNKLVLGLSCVLFTTGIGITYGVTRDSHIEWVRLISIIGACLLLSIQLWKYRPLLLLSAITLNSMITTYPLLMRQQFADIVKTSLLTEKIKAYLPNGSRYAVSDPGMGWVLTPNINASLGIKSIHTYNSLSSIRYHKIIKDLGGSTKTYGRHNGTIYPDYTTTEFWMSNIGIILSKNEIIHDNLELMAIESGIYLHKNKSRMGDSIQIVPTKPMSPSNIEKLDIRNTKDIKLFKPIKTDDQGDLKEFRVTSTNKSIFLISQKYHQNWQAFAYTGSKWKEVTTLDFNTKYQSAILPPKTTRVRLKFNPFINYAWIPHIFWIILTILVGQKAISPFTGRLKRYVDFGEKHGNHT